MRFKSKLFTITSFILISSFFFCTSQFVLGFRSGLFSVAMGACLSMDEEDPEEGSADHAPWGKIEDLMIKVGGNDAERDCLNRVYYQAPKDLRFGGLCKIGLGPDADEDVDFDVEWSLTNGVVNTPGHWKPTLEAGEFDELRDFVFAEAATEPWYGHITIKAKVGNFWATLTRESVTFIPN